MLQDFVHVLDLDQCDVLQHLLRNFVDILLVFLRHEDGLDAATIRRQHLLLSPPIGSTRPRSVISPVIARSLRTGTRQSADTSAVASVIPADGPSFGIAPSGI